MKRFDVYLRNKVTKFTVYLNGLPFRDYRGLRNRLVLLTSKFCLLLGIYVNPKKVTTTLKTQMGVVSKIVRNKISSAMILTSSVLPRIGLYLRSGKNKTALTTSEVTVTINKYSGLQHRLVLLSDKCYLLLKKIISPSKTKMTLNTKIGTVTKIVRNEISSATTLISSVLTRIGLCLKGVDNTLTLTAHNAALTIGKYTGLRQRTILRNGKTKLMFGTLFNPVKNKMTLNTSKLSFAKTTYEKLSNVLVITSLAIARTGKFLSGTRNSTALSSSDATLSIDKYTGGKNAIHLGTKTGEVILGSPIRVKNRIALSVNVTNWWGAKKLSAIHLPIHLINRLAESITKMASAKGRSVLTHAVNASMFRHRLLYEVDDLSLADLDNLILRDMDFVELV